jgi:hypothetical protein
MAKRRPPLENCKCETVLRLFRRDQDENQDGEKVFNHKPADGDMAGLGMEFIIVRQNSG